MKKVAKEYSYNISFSQILFFIILFFCWSFAYTQTSQAHWFNGSIGSLAVVWFLGLWLFEDMVKMPTLPRMFVHVPASKASQRYIRNWIIFDVGILVITTIVFVVVKLLLLSINSYQIVYLTPIYFESIAIVLFLFMLVRFRVETIEKQFFGTYEKKEKIKKISQQKKRIVKVKLKRNHPICHTIMVLGNLALILIADLQMKPPVIDEKQLTDKGIPAIFLHKEFRWFTYSNGQTILQGKDYVSIVIFGVVSLVSILHIIWYTKSVLQKIGQR